MPSDLEELLERLQKKNVLLREQLYGPVLSKLTSQRAFTAAEVNRYKWFKEPLEQDVIFNVVPDVTRPRKFRYSFKYPDKWEVTDEGIIVSPEGNAYTREEYNKLQKEEQAKIQRQKEAFGGVFPGVNIGKIEEYRKTYPEAFESILHGEGLTQESERLLKEYGLSPEQITKFYTPQFPEKEGRLRGEEVTTAEAEAKDFYGGQVESGEMTLKDYQEIYPGEFPDPQRITPFQIEQAFQEAEYLLPIVDYATKDPEGFKDDILTFGRNPNTEALLRTAFGATNDEIDRIFTPKPVTKRGGGATTWGVIPPKGKIIEPSIPDEGIPVEVTGRTGEKVKVNVKGDGTVWEGDREIGNINFETGDFKQTQSFKIDHERFVDSLVNIAKNMGWGVIASTAIVEALKQDVPETELGRAWQAARVIGFPIELCFGIVGQLIIPAAVGAWGAIQRGAGALGYYEPQPEMLPGSRFGGPFKGLFEEERKNLLNRELEVNAKHREAMAALEALPYSDNPLQTYTNWVEHYEQYASAGEKMAIEGALWMLVPGGVANLPFKLGVKGIKGLVKGVEAGVEAYKVSPLAGEAAFARIPRKRVPPAVKTEVPVGVKEPWQMTLEEFKEATKTWDYKGLSKTDYGFQWKPGFHGATEQKGVGIKSSWYMGRISRNEVSQKVKFMREDYHLNKIRQALSEGKPVPAEVLKDYPDLAKLAKVEAPAVPEGVTPKVAPVTDEGADKLRKLMGMRTSEEAGVLEHTIYGAEAPRTIKVVDLKTQEYVRFIDPDGKEVIGKVMTNYIGGTEKMNGYTILVEKPPLGTKIRDLGTIADRRLAMTPNYGRNYQIIPEVPKPSAAPAKAGEVVEVVPPKVKPTEQISEEMAFRLNELGYDWKTIYEMTPEQATAIAAKGTKAPLSSMTNLRIDTDIDALIKENGGDFGVVVKDVNGARMKMNASDFNILKDNPMFADRVREVWISGLKPVDKPTGHAEFMSALNIKDMLSEGAQKPKQIGKLADIGGIKLSNTSTVTPTQKQKFVEMITDNNIRSNLKELGIKQVIIEPPYKFGLSEQANISTKDSIIRISADATDPIYTMMHELGHAKFEALSEVEKNALRQSIRQSKDPRIQGYLRGGYIDEAIADTLLYTEVLPTPVIPELPKVTPKPVPTPAALPEGVTPKLEPPTVTAEMKDAAAGMPDWVKKNLDELEAATKAKGVVPPGELAVPKVVVKPIPVVTPTAPPPVPKGVPQPTEPPKKPPSGPPPGPTGVPPAPVLTPTGKLWLPEPPRNTSTFMEFIHKSMAGKFRGKGTSLFIVEEAHQAVLKARDMGDNVVAYVLGYTRQAGNVIKEFGLTTEGLATKVGNPEGRSLAINDILSNYTHYKLTPKQLEIAKREGFVYSEALKLAESYGVKINKLGGPDEFWQYIARRVKGKKNPITGEYDMPPPTIGGFKMGAKIGAQKKRMFEEMMKGVDLQFLYDNPDQAMAHHLKGIYRLIGNKQAENLVMPLTRVISKKAPVRFAERKIAEPALQNRAANVEIANAIDKIFSPEVTWKPLEVLANISGAMVGQISALDGSVHFIQALPILGRDIRNATIGKPSIQWLKGWQMWWKSVLNPENILTFRANNPQLYKEGIEYGLMSGLAEFVYGVPLVQRGLGKIPKVGKTLAEVYKQSWGRLGQAYSDVLEFHKFSLLGIMKDKWIKAGGNAYDLGDMLNRIAGGVSSKARGVPKIQSDIERLNLFAANYFRASLLLLKDMASGGMKAKEVGSILTALLGFGAAVYYAEEKVRGREPKMKPWPKKYGGDGAEAYTTELAGQRVGIGSWTYGMIKMLAEVGAIAVDEPGALIVWSDRHPVAKFFKSKRGPLMSLVQVLSSGRTFFGQKLEGPIDYLTQFLNGTVMPIMGQSLIERKELGIPKTPEEQAITIGAEFLGLRTFPYMLKSQWTDQGALKEYEDIPTDEIELKLAKEKDPEFLNRTEWRKKEPTGDAKLFIIGEVGSLLTYEAVEEAERIIKETNIDPMSIKSISNRQDKLTKAAEAGLAPPERDTFLDNLMKKLGIYGVAKAAEPEVIPTPPAAPPEVTPTPPGAGPPPKVIPLTPEEQKKKIELARGLAVNYPKEKEDEIRILIEQDPRLEMLFPYYYLLETDKQRTKLREQFPELDMALQKIGIKPLTEEPLLPEIEDLLTRYKELKTDVDKYEFILIHKSLKGQPDVKEIPPGLTIEFARNWKKYKDILGGKGEEDRKLEYLVNNPEFSKWYRKHVEKVEIPEELTPEMFRKVQNWKTQNPKDKNMIQLADPELNDYVVKYENAKEAIELPERSELEDLYDRRLKGLTKHDDIMRVLIELPQLYKLNKSKEEGGLGLNLPQVSETDRKRLKIWTPDLENKEAHYKNLIGAVAQRNYLYNNDDLYQVRILPRSEGGKGMATLPPKNYWDYQKLSPKQQRELRRKDSKLEKYLVEERNLIPVPPVNYEDYMKLNKWGRFYIRSKDNKLNEWLIEYKDMEPLDEDEVPPKSYLEWYQAKGIRRTQILKRNQDLIRWMVDHNLLGEKWLLVGYDLSEFRGMELRKMKRDILSGKTVHF